MDRITQVFWVGLLSLLAVTFVGGLRGHVRAVSAAEITPSDAQSPDQIPHYLDNPAAQPLSKLPTSRATASAYENEEPADSQASPLPWAAPIADRSDQLEEVAREADKRTRHGYELAQRGAYFAARAEFVGALRLVAEGLDAEQKNNIHSRALAAALQATKEAEDFLPDNARWGTTDLSNIVATHDTPVLKDSVEGVTSLAALRCYLTFAQEQFAVAAGREVAGSMALHALGKLHAAIARKKDASIVAPESKAVVFYQASLLAFPENPMAANDLGVLLAQCGRFQEARPLFERSLARFPQSTGWRNLSVVYGQIGQPALAQQAAAQAELLHRQELAKQQNVRTSGNGAVQWLDPEAFARSSTNPLMTPGPVPGRVEAPATNVAAAQPQAVPARTTDRPSPAPPTSAERMRWGARTYQR